MVALPLVAINERLDRCDASEYQQDYGCGLHHSSSYITGKQSDPRAHSVRVNSAGEGITLELGSVICLFSSFTGHGFVPHDHAL